MSDSLNVYKNCSLVVIQILMLVKDQRLQLTKHILNVNHTSRYLKKRISELSETFVIVFFNRTLIVYLCAYY